MRLVQADGERFQELRFYGVIRIDEKDSVADGAIKTLIARPGKSASLVIVDDQNLGFAVERRLGGIKRPERPRQARPVPRVARYYYARFHGSDFSP